MPKPSNSDPRSDRSRIRGLDAIRFLLESEGWEAVTHLRVAEQSGLGRATVYRHWPHRTDLLRDSLAGEILAVTVLPTDDLRRDLLTLLTLIRNELVDHGLGRVLAALIDRAEWDPEIRDLKQDIARQGAAVIGERIEAAIERHEVIAPVDVPVAVSQLLGPMVFRQLVSDEPIGGTFLKQLVDAFMREHEFRRS